jgi:hypothetical protein
MIYSVLKGRIGNNLFQIAAGYTLAARNNTEFVAYIPDFILPEPDRCTLKVYLEQFRNSILRNVKFTETFPPEFEKYIESEDLSYREIPFKENLVLDGYFQSDKYFDRDLIRDLFSLDKKTAGYINEKYGEILRQGATSINVRRGDFVKQPHLHPVCSMKYYKAAIKHFGGGERFMIISDDIEWSKRHFSREKFYFVEDEPPVVDLWLQAYCRNNIISNSSFSWWGSWLNTNPDKVVIAPSENWVGKHHNVTTKDLLPAGWIEISNPLAFRMRLIVLSHDIIKILVSFKKLLIRF